MSEAANPDVEMEKTNGNITDWHDFTIKELLAISKANEWHEVNQDLAKAILSLSKYNPPKPTAKQHMTTEDVPMTTEEIESEHKENDNDDDTMEILDTVRNELECNICLNFYVEPITISCGHTFCRLCIYQFQSKCVKKCPLCKRVCHIDASHHPQTIVINNCIKKLISKQQYDKRLQALELEKDSLTKHIPVFILNMVRYPGMLLRLHLFEPRYKHMMNRAISSGNVFAYLCKTMNGLNGNDYRPYEGDMALLVKIKDCQFLPDGRCLMTGICAKRILVEQTWIEDGTQGLWFVKYKDIKDDEVEQKDANRIDDDVLEQIKVISSFVSDCHSGSAAVIKAIEQECGDRIQLNQNYDNIEGWSFYVVSLIYTALRRSASLSNSWTTICLKTTNVLERIQSCYDVLRSIKSKN